MKLFGFLKLRSAKLGGDHNRSTSALEDRRKSARINFDEKDFEAILKGYFRPSNLAALFYARCCGFTGKTIDERNIHEFVQVLLGVAPESVDIHGKQFSFACFEQDVIDSLSSDYMELHWSIAPTEGEELRIPRADLERLRQLQKLCSEKNVSSLATLFPGLDMVSRTFEYILELRRTDIELMLSELDKRKEFIKPIFRKLQRRRINRYGDEDFGTEIAQLEEFLDSTFREEDFNFFWSVKPVNVLLDFIDEMLADELSDVRIPIDGIEFEHWCAERLREQGWNVTVSRASGDQGVDVVARRDGVEVAIQCKRYSSPIGNKAVQEAFAGAHNEGVRHSCVVGTGGFTASAKELATATHVHLIDASDIGSFSKTFGFVDTASRTSKSEDDKET